MSNQTPDNINLWSDGLGLLPVPLFSDRADNQQEQPKVLLNGSSGNFVLDWTGVDPNDDPRNYAWSSNVGHYILVKGDVIEVQRWDKNRAVLERYRQGSVLANLEGFHAYLEKNAPRAELSIVTHTIRVFRRLRTMLGSEATGTESLQAFLYLLACAREHNDREKVELSRWGLSSSAKSIATSIPTSQWDMLIDEIKRGRPSEQLIPHLNLLLRHAAGQLFQEAHYEAVFLPLQLPLEGFLPKPAELRKSSGGFGVHFTPSFLVRTLVEAALKADTPNATRLTIFDPACGSGEFLREVLRQLKLRGDQRPVHLIGWDISEAACAMANFVLAVEQIDTSNVTIDIRCVDALAEQEWPKQVDIVLMNPPFVSWQDMEPDQRNQVHEVLGSLVGARPDLSHAFVFKAVTCLRTGGVFSTILPASFLTSESAQHIRANLGDELAPRLIARLGSQLLFPGALVDAACYVAIKSSSPEMKMPTVAFWADPRRSSSTTGLRMLRKLRYWANPSVYPVEGNGFSIYMHPRLGQTSLTQEKSTWSPPPYNSWKLYQNLNALPTVGDLFLVHQGTRTGHKPAFILRRDKWKDLPKGEQAYFRPALVNEAIQDGKLFIVSYVFYPYGEHEIKTEAELIKLVPEYYQHYLLPNQEILHNRAGINRDLWWTLTRSRNWQESPKTKLVSTTFGDAGSFAVDATGEFVVVQGLNWQPKKEVKSNSRQRKIYFAYLSILNSSLFSNLLAATSRQISGGQWELAKQYVDPILIPDLFSADFSPMLLDELSRLGEQGRHILEEIDSRILELLAPLYRFDT